jgi:hypothetical protein
LRAVVVAILAVLLGAGCGKTVWVHTDGSPTEQQWNRDVSECERDRLMVMGPRPDLLQTALANENFDRCMAGKGYRKEK